ncbi:MAG: hypothetical protein Q9172_001045 [Xanthocarpia lactea]
MSATPPAKVPQLQRNNLPSGVPGLPSNFSRSTAQIANISLYEGKQIGCFRQRIKPLTPLHPVGLMDCYTNMARAVLLGDLVMDRRRWSKNNTPYTYSAGSCLIILDFDDETAVDYFSEAEIAHLAAIITFPCVAHNDEPLGGRTRIGAKGEFTVTVFGRKPPPD